MMETNTLTQAAHEILLQNEWSKINWSEWIGESSTRLGFFLVFLMVAGGYIWYKNKIKIPYTRVIQAVVFVFACGWIIYMIGFFSEGTKNSPIALIIRSAISSVEMFVSHSDLLEVHEYWKHNAFYMTFFALIHFSAILLSGIVIIHYLGVRSASKIRLWRLNRKKKRIKNLYIFWNVDENSINLAEDIHKEEDTKDNQKKDKVIVFVESQEKEGPSENRLSFSHFFSHFSFPKELLDKINSLDGILIRAKYRLNNGMANDNDTLRKLGLDRLIRKSQHVYFFLLSENENLNLLSALNLKNDHCVQEKSFQKKEDDKLQIFCHAFKDSANRVFESESTPSIEIKVVDSSYLSVISLKSACKPSAPSKGLWRPYSYHPVNYISVDKKGTGVATSCFSSLIVGFGETGQEALRFLFEFGQFPYDPTQENAYNFKCSVCDKAMDVLQGRFFMKTPALANPETGITYHPIDYASSEFWKHLHTLLNELNYIVIAVGDDEKGISLAVDIYEFAERCGKNLSENFSIFVRSYKRVNEKLLSKIAEKYKDTLVIFGASSDIFVKKLVIDDELLKMAQKFYYEYSRQEAGPEKLALLENTSPEALWNERRKKVTDRLDYQDLIRKEGQDISNCMHIYTKIKLIGGTDALPNLEPYQEIFKMKEAEEIKKQYRKSVFLENLARGEHKRWNAAHYAMGYTRLPKEEQVGGASCCKARKKHLCLVSWEELPEISTTDYQTYDRTVVQTSFYFAMSNR